MEPFVLIAPQGSSDRRGVQWYEDDNVWMLTSSSEDELRAYARNRFRAGLTAATVSLHGQSRGATGALFLAFWFPHRFGSAVANSFVSDYALARLEQVAARNRARILATGIPIRMTIGEADLASRDRVGSPRLHAYLDTLGVPHQYETLPGVPHTFAEVWKYRHTDGVQAGLRDLQFHQATWRRQR